MRVVPPDDDRPPVGRPGRLSRAELVVLVQRILDARPEDDEEQLVALFAQSVTHPAASSLIFWPEGDSEPTAEAIVDQALAHRPIEL